MTGLVRTATGDISPEQLGRTDYHEHLFQVTPLLPGDELEDEELSRREAASLHEAGIDAMVDATPTGLGRNPEAVARISATTGLTVVLTTGAHREAHYCESHWLRGVDEVGLERRFLADLIDGVPVRDDPGETSGAVTGEGAAVRAGILKAGIGYWSVSTFERRILRAVGTAHRRTGAPVMVHLEHGSAAHEVLDLLAADGVRESRVVLAHVDRNPDPGHLSELAARGSYLGFDGMARTREWPDSVLLDCIARLVDLGAERALVLGGDVARRTRYAAYGGMPGLAYLPRRFLPRLVEVVGTATVDSILRTNPARLLAWSLEEVGTRDRSER